jgi:hypothetical protein
MTPEDHKQQHIKLHRALGELLACYVCETRHRDCPRGLR